ncbi:glycosyl transferase family 2 [Coriobacterium glomerans PW2]|uniref:Glycosyl transferase family 2 n=1 Tax=Coriobacterium glomerans (strain ATCC 49209 / DSM 20642 / JCM 10262 / PW2) TaxID=700015 RepID=F2N843_CORGP|nr:glycosyltransferase family 2 protein [Coriobacterium glomerans]AEB07226.1 glycosyl transferase family 2 [Coriobacterium glomerans PW2]
MKLSIGKMCRGQGIAYILTIVQYDEGHSVAFSALSESGVNLPIEAYPSDLYGHHDTAFVLATPLLETSRICIKAEEIDVNGEIISSVKKKLSRFRIKWSSRLNYKIDPRVMSHLRDIDRFTYSNQIHIRPIHYSATAGPNIIVKGIICSPEHENEVRVQLLRADGVEDKDFQPYLSKSQEILYEGVRRVETQFTARVPNDGLTYCLVASGCNGSRAGFMCFDGPSRDFYRQVHTPCYYRISEFDHWQNYSKDRARKFELANIEDYRIDGGPVFSIIVPLYNTPVSFFIEMVQSVLGQLYQNWELILVNSTPENAALQNAIESLSDGRIHVLTLAHNLGISENTNAGMGVARGDYIAFLDHDDLLDKLVLYRYAKAIKDDDSIDALYCDEDFLTEDGFLINPHLKSDFNLDLLRCHNYITHFLAVRTAYVAKLRLRKAFDGAQDYDFLLRLVGYTQNIVHIPEVLYHWRMSDSSTAKDASNKGYAEKAGLLALKEHLTRSGLCATAEVSDCSCFYRTRYKVSGNPLVSIIIPNKDSVKVLSRCIESIINKTSYSNYEILVVENNSEDEETFRFYEDSQRNFEKVRVVHWPHGFNYSKINNFAVQKAKGNYILMLNNDTEVISPTWLESMLGFCQRPDVGIVGAKLLYPDDTIQHAGVSMLYCTDLGQMGGPVHVFCDLDKSDPGYMNRAFFSQDVSIVTGACLLTKRSVFESVGGLTDSYAVAYNDVDYCLKVRAKDLLVVYDADALLYHYESFSRGSDKNDRHVNRFISEQGQLRHDWPQYFSGYDPYYGKYLT